MRLRQALIRTPGFDRPASTAEEQGSLTTARLARFPVTDNAQAQPSPLFRLAEIGREPRAVINPRLSPRTLSFAAVVLLPIALVASYFLLIAADQYVAEFRFSLNTADAPRLDPLSLLTGNPSRSPAALESQIVVQYLTSRAIVDELGTTLNLRRMFSPPQADWWARLPLPAPIETLVQYWKGQVDPFYDPTNGTVTVRVRAFSAADALELARTIVGASEKLVNDLSLRGRRDRVRSAEAEVGQAEGRLQFVLGEIRGFRDREGLIDPGESAKTSSVLAARLRDELVRANAELSTLKTYMREDAPAVKVLNARIRSLETQRRAVAQDITDPDKARPGTLSHLLGSYEQLESERKFAEAAYQHALLRLDQARADADRQQIYIASFVPPMLPEEALYPRRWRSLGIVALVAFALWGIGGLIIQSVRDHL
jgi:capsular polysaccharide transport system permease protein